ncbi:MULTISPECIES: hypothetical protein [unclassified Polaribacter]|uniref:hypothetical protein n=1 Tax=unclassified Polaribacter TaxID=196858 RepID=UPI0011BDCDE2|nr:MULTISPECIES: hypothetical protein [unclassified Polaribacter]TXD53109.1 hypothetical protein ES043_05280 [Polaribacter sp. IC063]TXD61229.1 hypothetical protein ES044_05250 [Polaribacter sp. IC066]
MIKQLVIDFFCEIEKRELKKNKNAKAVFWVQELQEVGYHDRNYIGVKKATRIYEKYVENKKKVSVKEPDKFLCDVMAQYLNYKNYEEYAAEKGPTEKIIKRSNKKNTWRFKEKVSAQKIMVSVGILCIFPLLFFIYRYNTAATADCIIWNTNLFEESSCAAKNAINNGRYNIAIDKFKKIEVTNETSFFSYGRPTIWYGKSEIGEISFFTHRGIHPETLKELKPITTYIIDKYVLVDQNEKTSTD